MKFVLVFVSIDKSNAYTGASLKSLAKKVELRYWFNRAYDHVVSLYVNYDLCVVLYYHIEVRAVFNEVHVRAGVVSRERILVGDCWEPPPVRVVFHSSNNLLRGASCCAVSTKTSNDLAELDGHFIILEVKVINLVRIDFEVERDVEAAL